MLAYIIRRILYIVPVVFGVAVITFILFNVAGGNAPAMMLGKHATQEDIDALAKELEIGGPVFASKDAREGPRAFKEKRKPVYTGE